MTTPVNSVTGGQTTSGTSAASSSSGLGGLTMNDFLTLMTAQLQNQDPLNPTDSNEFLNQLSELSTVEGISQLNTSMGSLSNSMLASQAVNSAALVGQTILAPASAVELSSGSSISGAVQVPSGATSVTLSITNSAGVTVAQVAMPTGAGMQGFSWNGQTADGGTAPPGAYSVSAAAVVGSTSEAATTYLNGTVASVTLDPSGSGVLLNTPQLGSVELSNVQQID
ncbi:MAG TPA: flagellar hook capping FlgD N-terminal domain-containing protein [Steroidobacteraceae bacterium]|nr:flagellar hook capping FlgD N-terminal domain-containing protein [Steroidobacteraceae bacterium]